MRNLLMLCALLISLETSLIAGVTQRSYDWINEVLFITYNDKTEVFSDWTDEAKYFWKHGSLPSQPSGNSPEMDEIIAAINSHRNTLNSHAKIINKQTDAITSLMTENESIRRKMVALENVAFTRVWTDVDGNSFTGIFIEYNLGSVKVQKILDNATYTIPAGRLTPECKEVALALDKFK